LKLFLSWSIWQAGAGLADDAAVDEFNEGRADELVADVDFLKELLLVNADVVRKGRVRGGDCIRRRMASMTTA
jgi:hypothetical protein